MQNITQIPQGGERQSAELTSFSVEDVFCGYIIRHGRPAAREVMLAQAVSFFLGVCFLTAAIGMVALPFLLGRGGPELIGMGAGVLFGAIAFYLLWFASRGTDCELHVDTKDAMLREVIANRAGRPTTVAQYSFDDIIEIVLDSPSEDAVGRLLLRTQGKGELICIAKALTMQLVPLRDRLAHDLMIVPPSTPSHAA